VSWCSCGGPRAACGAVAGRELNALGFLFVTAHLVGVWLRPAYSVPLGLRICMGFAGLAVGPRQGIFLWRGLSARAAAPTPLGHAGGVTTSGVSCAFMQRGMSTWEHCAPGGMYNYAAPRTGGVGSLLRSLHLMRRLRQLLPYGRLPARLPHLRGWGCWGVQVPRRPRPRSGGVWYGGVSRPYGITTVPWDLLAPHFGKFL
jgi:hypothetical protein